MRIFFEIIIVGLINFIVDLLYSPTVQYFSKAVLAEPFFQLIYLLTQTYVTLYAFITDNFSRFLVAALLFTPFTNWASSLLVNIKTLVSYFSTFLFEYSIYLIIKPLFDLSYLIDFNEVTQSAFLRSPVLKYVM